MTTCTGLTFDSANAAVVYCPGRRITGEQLHFSLCCAVSRRQGSFLLLRAASCFESRTGGPQFSSASCSSSTSSAASSSCAHTHTPTQNMTRLLPNALPDKQHGEITTTHRTAAAAGRGWPRTVQLDEHTVGTLFYDLTGLSGRISFALPLSTPRPKRGRSFSMVHAVSSFCQRRTTVELKTNKMLWHVLNVMNHLSHRPRLSDMFAQTRRGRREGRRFGSSVQKLRR